MQFQTTKPRFGDQVPPAIFPPVLGLIGLTLGWSRASDVIGVPKEIADLFLGAVTLLLLFSIVAYTIKFLRRPRVLTEDLRTLPGRAGLAAMCAALLCLAAAMVPFSQDLARGILFSVLSLYMVLAVLKIRFFLTIPPDQRQVTPVWHLSFVGVILAPLSAIPLGYVGFSQAIYIFALAAACVIWTINLRELWVKGCPPPLRPTIAIHLAPICFFSIVADGLGWMLMSKVFGIAGLVVFVVLLVRARYLTAAGFTPFWGAFTFPLAGFTSAMLVMSAHGMAFGIIGALALAAASAIIPIIAFRVLKLWARGQLAIKTNAARV